MYEYLNNVLGCYFNVNISDSEQEAVSALREDMVNNPMYAEGLRAELQTALYDKTYSWKNAFIEHDVVYIETEEEARAYAKKILWDELFAA